MPTVTWRGAAGNVSLAAARPRAVVAERVAELASAAGTPRPVALETIARLADRIARIDQEPHRYARLFHTSTIEGVAGEGSAQNGHDALVASVFEALERGCATHYDDRELTSARATDLGPLALDVRSLVLPTPEECDRGGYVPYRDDLQLSWARCFELRGADVVERLVPATLAILRFSWANPDQRFAPTLSAGIAWGADHADAIMHALYELIERDAFVIAWLNRLSCPIWQVETLGSATLDESRARLVADGFEARFVDLTTELGIPAAMALVTHPDDPRQALSVGLGANLDPLRAVRRAYAEALEMMVNVWDFTGGGRPEPRHVRLDRGLDLAAYSAECAFLGASPVRRPLIGRPRSSASSLEDLELCRSALDRHDVRLYFSELTPPELAVDARHRLVRVFATRLQPHVYEWDCWRLANPRIFTSPVASGARATPLQPGDLNLTPHLYTVYDSIVEENP